MDSRACSGIGAPFRDPRTEASPGCHRPVRMMRQHVACDSVEFVPTSATRDRLEIVATVLLAVAAVATAWASYQATRWNGEQSKAASRTNALRIEAARAQGLA